jgi:tetratricopeptide (TPR) repeat protein
LNPTPETRDKLRAAVAIQHQIESGFDDAVHFLDGRQYAEAIETLNRILSLKPDLAKARGRLGTAYAAIGKDQLAAKQLQMVAKFDADNPYGYAMRGWLAYLHDDADQAVNEFRRADEIEPYSAQINYQWGLALAKLARWDEAVQHFRQVVTIDPAHAGGCQALAHALRQTGQFDEALGYARRAASLSRFENADVLLTLAEVYADLGRFGEAVEAANKALDAAQKHSPQSAPQIRQRLDELRARARLYRKNQTGKNDVR